MSAEEKFANDNNSVGAITSFAQEQALAGAGGTAAFTAYGIKNTSYLTSSDYHTGHVISNLYDNYLRRAGTLVAISSSDTVSFAYDFSTPQIVTKYRMLPRATSDDNDVQAPSSWELRAATTKTLYDDGTYIILDSHYSLSELDWNQTIVYDGSSTELNSDYLSKANGYNLSTIGAKAVKTDLDSLQYFGESAVRAGWIAFFIGLVMTSGLLQNEANLIEFLPRAISIIFLGPLYGYVLNFLTKILSPR